MQAGFLGHNVLIGFGDSGLDHDGWVFKLGTLDDVDFANRMSLKGNGCAALWLQQAQSHQGGAKSVWGEMMDTCHNS